MRVLFLNHESVLGGAEIMLVRFFQACDREKFQCNLVLPKEGPLSAEAEKAGASIHLLPVEEDLLTVRRKSPLVTFSRIRNLLKTIKQLRGLILRSTPDIVISNSVKAHVYGSLALRGSIIPYGWRLHDIIDDRSFSKIQCRLLYALARRYPRSIAGVSEATCRPLRAAGIDPTKLSVMYNGIPVHESETSTTGFRSSLGFDEAHFLVTLPGRIMPQKGHEVLIRASQRVLKSVPQMRFLFVGEPFFHEFDYQSQLEVLIHELGLDRYFVFAGFRRDMEKIYAASDVVVQPSVLPDSFPTVILEAMAAGKSVVASDAGGAVEIITDGEDGSIVPAGDERALADKLIDIAMNGAIYERAAIKARIKVEAHFNLEGYVEGMQSWLESLSAIGKNE